MGDIDMSIDNSRLREDILDTIKQCTSYEFVDDNVNINELQVDAEFFLEHLKIYLKGLQLSASKIRGKNIGDIVLLVEKISCNSSQNQDVKGIVYKALRSCSANWFNQYVYISDARINYKLLVSRINESYGISLIKKELTRFPNYADVNELITFIENKIKDRIDTLTMNQQETKEIGRKNVMKTIDRKKIEYVIGIDLGHGETSAAICPLQWDTPVEQLDPVKDLEMGGNKKVIPSAITILDNGNAYIGDSAFNPEILKQAEVHVCFKKAPKDINGESEKLMMRFMQEVYKRIRENNSAMLTDNNHLVYIATPSGWDKQTQDLYLQMAKQAGLPMGGITKESRAAFVRAQHDVTSGLGKYVDKGAIVFDMGSSTLDFTYMTSNSKLIDHGYDCGASFIEKTIFKNCEEKFPAIQQFEKKYEKLTPFLLFEARKVKEQVYFDPNLKVKKTINFEDLIDDEDFEDDRFKMVFQPKELNSLLEQVGYIKEIEDAAYDFVNNHIHNASVYGVFLTGGASRMDFIKPLVSKCWNVPESQIYRDQDPSLTISQGVAEVARMDLRTEGMDAGLEDAINQLQNSDTIYNAFTEKLSNALFEKVTDDVANVIVYFRDAEEDYSLSDLQTAISETAQDSINDIVPNIPAFMQESVYESTSEIQQKVESIIAHYSNQGINISIPSLSLNNFKVGNISINGIINSISDQIASESSDWAGAIGGAAVGGAIALILGGPLAWIIGGAAFLGQLFFGKSEEEKKKEAMTKDLNKEARGKVFESIEEKWEDIQLGIDRSINQSISRNAEIKQVINRATHQLLQDYKESLKKARILID